MADTRTNVSGNSLQPNVLQSTVNPTFQNIDPGATKDSQAAALANDLSWLQSNPSLLSRTLMRSNGQGGNQYAMDPYSQWLQNRAMAASTLATYFNPSAQVDANGQSSQMLGSAQNWLGGMNSNPGAGQEMWKKAADWVRHVTGPAGQALTPGDLSADPSAINPATGKPFGGIGLPDYLSATTLGGNPQVVQQLMGALAAGLPTPISDAVNNMMGRLYAQYQDLGGSTGENSFFAWLSKFM